LGKRTEDKERRITKAVTDLIKNADAQCTVIKQRWRENYDIFVNGTTFDSKEEWQTDFSINKFATSIRTAQGRLVSILVNNPDWYELCPRSYQNKDSEVLAPAFQKMMDYYLGAAKFKRHAGTFFLCSLISSGSVQVGWKPRLVLNPEWVLDRTEKERKKVQMRLASKVTNPQIEDPSLTGDGFESDLSSAIDDFMAEAQGANPEKKDIPQYIQIGALDYLDINHERQYWDPNVMYMEDSQWRAFEYDVNKWELDQQAKLGLLSKDVVDRIGPRADVDAQSSSLKIRYNNTTNSPTSRKNLVKLTVYYGPLIINDEVKKDRYYCVIANDSILLKEGDYPYWEPPGHYTPIITAAVRQVPYRATGAGIGDTAVKLQKIYDSNWQLVCDTFRFGIAGVNVVDYSKLVDKSQLLEGIYPGMTLEVRGDPKEAFQHIDLTSNLENQAHPVQSMLEQAIDQLTGINELMTGGANPFSRTSAAETTTRVESGNQNVNTIAIDLEDQFLVPALEKSFSRVLQFGMLELESNPELKALFDEEEMYALTQLSAQGRMEILNQWYRFKIKGFSSSQDKNEAAQRDNELLQIINSGGPLSQLINLPEYMKQYFKNRDIKDVDKLLITSGSPLEQVEAEHRSLLSGHQVIPSQADDHEFHIKMHGPLAQSPMSTPEMQQHFQMHQMAMQQMQAAQAQQGAGQGQPPQGQPVQ
jgi:hypothetical protein